MFLFGVQVGGVGGNMNSREYNGKDDTAVIRQVLDGDADAFSILIERYGQAINTQMRNYGRDAGISEELAHEVFVQAYLNLAGYRGDSPFYNWLSRIATFTGIKYWKERGKKNRFVEFSEERDGIGWNESQHEERSPEQAKKLVYDMLSTLPETDRLVLTLAYLEECSHDEISRRLGWHKALIAMRLFKAKGKLRKLAAREPWKGKVQWMIS